MVGVARGVVSRGCPVCGTNLDGQRADAVTCSAACRRELARFRAVVSGQARDPYLTLDQLQNRARRRAKVPQRP